MKTLKTFTLGLLALFSLTILACEKDVGGCTDPQSFSYNPDATMDDGSCVYTGCTDPASENYNPQANVDDGSCQYKGCTDVMATNYDPDASIDDGNCTYERDQFTGAYAGDEICVENGIEARYTWDMTISPGSSTDVSEVIIENLGDFGVTMIGKVNGNELTYSFDQDGVVIFGNGTLTGNQITFKYIAAVPAFGISLTCTGTATRQ